MKNMTTFLAAIVLFTPLASRASCLKVADAVNTDLACDTLMYAMVGGKYQRNPSYATFGFYWTRTSYPSPCYFCTDPEVPAAEQEDDDSNDGNDRVQPGKQDCGAGGLFICPNNPSR